MELEEKEDATKKCAEVTKPEPEEDGSSGHTCGVCGRTFPLLSSLSQHMRRHTREKPYKCPYCEHRTAQKGSLKAHVRSHKLGLLTPSSADKEGDGEVTDNAATSPAPPPAEKAADKKHNVNGKVKKKAAKKNAKSQDDSDDSGAFTCSICNQVFPQVLLLKSHMKRHRNVQDYGCKVCGRRFRQAWFLQSHMRIHRVTAQAKGGKAGDLPATVNGVPQDPLSLINDECLYELCSSCGNFFHDLETLQVHEQLHQFNRTRSKPQSHPKDDSSASEVDFEKRQFMKSLSLMCAGEKVNTDEQSQGKRILELDPVCSYQAWQLATRGRLVEVTEKCLGWEERLADAEVVYDMDKGEYIPLKDRKRKQTENPGSGVKKKKSDTGLSNNIKTLDKKICQDRILLNGLGHAFYEAMQAKKVKGTPSTTKSSQSQEPEDKKPIFCEHCDFNTVDAASLRSHLLRTHQDVLALKQISSKSSRYMDYLRSRSALLSQSYWNPYTYTPVLAAPDTNIKAEKTNSAEVKGQGEPGMLLNLSAAEGDAVSAAKSEGLVKNHCPYCSHTSNYPEVLWIHQRVAHKVDGSSSMAPKWAPCPISFKSLKTGSSPWRRTGPPPFLEGKDCPTLSAPRTHRTQPPTSKASTSSSSRSSSGSSKNSGQKSHSAVPKPKPTAQSKSPRPAEAGRTAPQRTSADGSSKGNTSGIVGEGKSVNNAQASPKHRSHRAAVKGNFPQEGLGFMLARNHSSSASLNSNRLHPQRQSRDPASGLKGNSDLWAALNMWGLHGSKAYLDPLPFSQGKSESAGQMPMDINILSLLKNYSPRDLAALYQHWGFVDPRLDPQAMLQLNEHYADDVHSSEAAKQVSSHPASSGSLHKGT